ncbi:transcriptional regulator GlxA family with amidase domain [Phyllobacterium sp. 1468]|nr:transcriptional regulator GlxA family with amidase domain [Phyllobacterium sp. 1468]
MPQIVSRVLTIQVIVGYFPATCFRRAFKARFLLVPGFGRKIPVLK